MDIEPMTLLNDVLGEFPFLVPVNKILALLYPLIVAAVSFPGANVGFINAFFMQSEGGDYFFVGMAVEQHHVEAIANFLGETSNEAVATSGLLFRGKGIFLGWDLRFRLQIVDGLIHN